MLQNNAQLKSLIDKLWQNFWEGGIANPLTAIEQITYLIFMKRLDDLEAKRERDAEFTGEKYVSRFAGKFNVPGNNENIDKNELRWSVFNLHSRPTHNEDFGGATPMSRYSCRCFAVTSETLISRP